MKIRINNSSVIFGTDKSAVEITDFNTETDILKTLDDYWGYNGVYTVNDKGAYIKVTAGDNVLINNSGNESYGYYTLCKSSPASWPKEALNDTQVVKNNNYFSFWCNAGESKTITIPEGVEYILVCRTNEIITSITIN